MRESSCSSGQGGGLIDGAPTQIAPASESPRSEWPWVQLGARGSGLARRRGDAERFPFLFETASRPTLVKAYGRSMPVTLTVVDAFTDRPFSGSPAAVCLLDEPASEAWMQAVAAEMNLSETAFAVPRADGDLGELDLRWFTPSAEVDLCGHATLATAHVLGRPVVFHTRGGVLACRPVTDGGVEMDFPAGEVAPVLDPPDWASAMGLARDRIVGVYESPNRWALVEVTSPTDVRAVVPDRQAILDLGGFANVFASPGEEPGVDSVCRTFGPAVGIDEDPVTGSVHCLIAPLLAKRLGRAELVGQQVSARGGTVGMRVAGDRVHLTGRAVTVLVAELRSEPEPA